MTSGPGLTYRQAGTFAGMCAAMLLVTIAHQAFVGVPVTINGTGAIARRGESVARVLESRGTVPRGRMLAASADHRVLDADAGLPALVLVNGHAVPLATEVHSGDRISTIAGADVIEPVIEETRTIEPVSRTIGVGVTEKVISVGAPGYAVVRVGSLSGDVVTTETVVPATPGLARLVPAAGTNLIALTFDDGPWPGQTEVILQILRDRNVPATFFMLGCQVARAPELARQVFEEGHAVGNHTYWHVYLSQVSPEVAWAEIESTNQIIEQCTGVRPRWLRAPGGMLGGPAQAYIAQAGMQSALWNVDPQDWRSAATPEELAWGIIGAAQPGSVVVLHDGGGDQSKTIAILPFVIDSLRAQGYEFVTLDELPAVRAGW